MACLSLNVLDSSYTYPAPVGSIITTVNLEMYLKIFAYNASVILKLLPPLGPLETCEAEMLGEASMGQSEARWTGDFVLYPHVSYGAKCLLYNGPTTAQFSSWQLMVEVPSTASTGTLYFESNVTSTKYLVIPVLAGGQILALHPFLGAWQVLMVRMVTPVRDGFSLLHWKNSAHQWHLWSPSGYSFGFEGFGACSNFWPLSASALPPLPFTSCLTMEGGIQVHIEPSEGGFQANEVYAFQVSVENPRTFPIENRWTMWLMEDTMPLAQMEDVPSVLSSVTSALRPNDPQEIYDTSFRLYEKQIFIHSILAEDAMAGRNNKVQVEFTLSTPLRLGDVLVLTAPSAFAWVRPAVLYDATTATAAVAAFPAGLPEVPTFAAWMLRVDVLGNAMADVMYILVAMVINPTVQDWKGIDEDLNYWQLESLYQHTSFTRGESRRDFGVKKGFDVVGGLKHCAAQPSNRLRGMESWVSLTFQVAVPVGLQSWRQEDAPAKLRISLPNGFLLPVDASTCSDVLQRSADPETPQLRTVQFPRVYGPLPLLEGLVCTLTEKVLTVEFLPHVALLPSTVYAFRLRVISPTLDQVRGRFWSLQTVNFNDVEKESCTIDLWDSSGLLPDLPVPSVSAMPTLTVAYVLPLTRLPNASKVATLVIQASEGFAFPRSCAKEEVVECIGCLDQNYTLCMK